jgi:hypothetical protein
LTGAPGGSLPEFNLNLLLKGSFSAESPTAGRFPWNQRAKRCSITGQFHPDNYAACLGNPLFPILSRVAIAMIFSRPRRVQKPMRDLVSSAMIGAGRAAPAFFSDSVSCHGSPLPGAKVVLRFPSDDECDADENVYENKDEKGECHRRPIFTPSFDGSPLSSTRTYGIRPSPMDLSRNRQLALQL